LVRLSHFDTQLHLKLKEVFVQMAQYLGQAELLEQLKSVIDRSLYQKVEDRLKDHYHSEGPADDKEVTKKKHMMLPNINHL